MACTVAIDGPTGVILPVGVARGRRPYRRRRAAEPCWRRSGGVSARWALVFQPGPPVQAFAAGALLARLAATMPPEAYDVEGVLTGPLVVAGFALSVGLPAI
jgi:hypothetical protein